MNKTFKSIIAVVLLISFASFADLIKYVKPVNKGNTEKTSFGHVYTGLYEIEVDGQKWQTMCIDPLGTIHGGDTWVADHLGPQDIADNGAYVTFYGNDPALAGQKYAMISYLAENYYYNNPSMTETEKSKLSLAIWEIAMDFDGLSSSLNLTSGGFTANSPGVASGWLVDAFDYLDNDGDITMSAFSPSDRPSQEFIAWKVPEPTTACLLLMGLSMLGFAGWRRKRNS
ncbi:MAG: PEP-CTERM sorting domain-containing protein [Chitinivibrionales bacterium]|nr:PEP-CTERM sorting domain-containing protein [Chitinivibrionales bacterium]